MNVAAALLGFFVPRAAINARLKLAHELNAPSDPSARVAPAAHS